MMWSKLKCKLGGMKSTTEWETIQAFKVFTPKIAGYFLLGFQKSVAETVSAAIASYMLRT